MKKILFFLTFLLTTFSLSAQDAIDNPFEGQVYEIKSYINGKFDNQEDLIFAEGLVEGTVCAEYGFDKAVFQTIPNKKGATFTATMTSKIEGKMVWEGKLGKKGKTIAGTCLWTKEGQDDILLTFLGKLKSK